MPKTDPTRMSVPVTADSMGADLASHGATARYAPDTGSAIRPAGRLTLTFQLGTAEQAAPHGHGRTGSVSIDLPHN